jgi:hypothetical protein
MVNVLPRSLGCYPKKGNTLVPTIGLNFSLPLVIPSVFVAAIGFSGCGREKAPPLAGAPPQVVVATINAAQYNGHASKEILPIVDSEVQC